MLTRKMLGQGLPVLWTDRLLLRSLRQSDFNTLSELFSDPQVIQYVNRGGQPTPIRARRLLNQIRSSSSKLDSLHYGICWKGREQIIGITSFQHWNEHSGTAQIGYILNRSCWGMGVATEAVQRLLNFGFTELNLQKWKRAATKPMYHPNGASQKRDVIRTHSSFIWMESRGWSDTRHSARRQSLCFISGRACAITKG